MTLEKFVEVKKILREAYHAARADKHEEMAKGIRDAFRALYKDSVDIPDVPMNAPLVDLPNLKDLFRRPK